jgi:hypothetical protein
LTILSKKANYVRFAELARQMDEALSHIHAADKIDWLDTRKPAPAEQPVDDWSYSTAIQMSLLPIVGLPAGSNEML